MKNRIFAILAFACMCFHAGAQTLQEVLNSIGGNNLSLRSALLEKQAGEQNNRAERRLEGPEVEFDYLWGTETETGNRRDIRVTQNIDFATLSGKKSDRAKTMDEMLDIEYNLARQNVLLEAMGICIDLIYYNSLNDELGGHLENANLLVQAYERKVELGDASVMELNNARLHQSTVRGKQQKVSLERERLLSELQRLNGGQAIDCTEKDYTSLDRMLPDDFESFYRQASKASPAVNYARLQTDAREHQLGIDRSAWVPGLQVGYMSEITKAEGYRGVTVGVSIPLWSNASRVRQSRLEYQAAQSRQKETENDFYYSLAADYRQACGMRDIAREYRVALIEADNRAYLIKAQQQGEISIIEYISQIDLFYENLEETLETERNYERTVAMLVSMLL